MSNCLRPIPSRGFGLISILVVLSGCNSTTYTEGTSPEKTKGIAPSAANPPQPLSTKAVSDRVATSASAASNSRVDLAGVRKASDFPGNDAGEKILNAQADLLNHGINAGIIDATDFVGVQKITSRITLGNNWNNSFTLKLGRATFVLSKAIVVGRNSRIEGQAGGQWPWSTGAVANTNSTVLRAADQANLFPALVQLGSGSDGDGTSACLQDLILDGNFQNGGTAKWGNGILIQGAAADLTRLSVLNSGGHGISIVSSSINNLHKVFSGNNFACGLAVTNTNDTFVTQSQFEVNGTDGICLNNAGAFRISTSDIGGNTGNGINAFGGSTSEIIVGNQFGNNLKHDLFISGGWGANVINGNQFIGSANRSSADTYSAIFIDQSQNSSISGNFINMASGANRLHSGIRLNSGLHSVAGNTITGSRGPGGAISLGRGAVINANADSTTP